MRKLSAPKLIILGSAIVLILAAVNANAQRKPVASSALTLEQFLEQVRDKNQSYRASARQKEAAQLIAEESSLILAPQLFGSAQHLDDQKPNLVYQYSSMFQSQYQLGVSQLTTVGLQGKLYYTLSQTDFQGSRAPRSWDAKPTLELSQSLWRNWLGAETQSLVDLSEANAKANLFAESYKAKTVLLEAESAYWRLALAREAESVAKDSVIRGQKLVEWSNRRSTLGLADKSDSLQSTANLQARRLDLEAAQDDLRAAARNFNRARGMDGDDVNEKLLELSPTVIAQLKVPQVKKSIRDDVKAAEQLAIVAKSSAKSGVEKNTPTLELFGAVSLNGSDETSSKSIDNGWKSDQRTALVGIRFSAPLEFGTSSRVRQGYRLSQSAAELNFDRKKFEEERDWSDLVARFRDLKERLDLYDKLIDVQSEKYTNERSRQSSGRSTVAQVLVFELDLENAQFGRLRSLTELLNLNAQLKLYGVEQ